MELDDNSLDALEAQFRAALADAQAGLADVAAARRLKVRAAAGVLPVKAEPQADQSKPKNPRVFLTPEAKARIAAAPKSLGEAILLVLERAENPWMTANQIQHQAMLILQRRVPMSSVSPKLTDLKKDGLILRDDLKVALASRVTPAEKPKDLIDVI